MTAFRNTIQGPRNVRRTLTMQEVAEELEIPGSPKQLKQLFERLRIRHHLRASAAGNTRRYNADEVEKVFGEHQRHCGNSPICFPDRFSIEAEAENGKKARKPVSANLNMTDRVHNFIRHQPDGEYFGTLGDLVEAMKSPSSQVLQALNTNIQRGRIGRIEGGGWRSRGKQLPVNGHYEAKTAKEAPKPKILRVRLDQYLSSNAEGGQVLLGRGAVPTVAKALGARPEKIRVTTDQLPNWEFVRDGNGHYILGWQKTTSP